MYVYIMGVDNTVLLLYDYILCFKSIYHCTHRTPYLKVALDSAEMPWNSVRRYKIGMRWPRDNVS